MNRILHLIQSPQHDRFAAHARRAPLVALSFAIALALFALLAAITAASPPYRSGDRQLTPESAQPVTSTQSMPVPPSLEAPFLSALRAWAAPAMDPDMARKRGPLGKLDISLLATGEPVTTSLDLLLSWFSPDVEATTAVAWADVDDDGDLDLAVANRNAPDRLLINTGGTLSYEADSAWSSAAAATTDLAWGDVDGDGDPDLVTAGQPACPQPGSAGACTGGQEHLYRNDDGRLASIPAWSSPAADDSSALALGDVDGDRDLDLAVSNRRPASCQVGQPCPLAASSLYLNQGGTFGSRPVWTSADQDGAEDLTWGDVDRDGDLDLITVTAGGVRWFANDIGVLAASSARLADTGGLPAQVLWADLDDDGFGDLLTLEPVKVSLFAGGAQGLSSQPTWQAQPGTFTATAMGLGDYDADGLADLAVGTNCAKTPDNCRLLVYHNDGGDFGDAPVWQSGDHFNAFGVAWGDADGDGDLDLAVGAGGYANQPNRLYRNLDTPLSAASVVVTATAPSQALAWGDVDGDGDLDLAVASASACDLQPPLRDPCADGFSRVFRNQGDRFDEQPAWMSPTPDVTAAVAWGDVDGDGDLDLALGNGGQPNRLVLNLGGVLAAQPAWQSEQSALTRSLAWGDVDGDGDPDLAVGNVDEAPHLYRNDGGQLTRSFVWSGLEATPDPSLAWGDVDGDGDLDLAVGDTTGARLYLNQGGTLVGNAAWSSAEPGGAVAWRDTDLDGDLDLLVGNRLYRNEHVETLATAGAPQIAMVSALPVGEGSQPPIFDTPQISVTYRITLPSSGQPVDVRGFYSLDGGGAWQPASVLTGTRTLSLTEGAHVYLWEVARDGLMGQSDSVVVRLEARPARVNLAHATPQVPVVGPASASSAPFRVRGTQVRVYDEVKGQPAAGAVVFRLKKGQTSGATPLGDATSAYRTDANGYLQGRGQIQTGDTLYALLPVTASLTTPASKVSVYHTSARPTAAGLAGHVVREPGLQELVVSKAHPLFLFDVALSLEWDARNDGTFLADLEQAIKRSSEMLFDVANGQMALGAVTVYQDRGNWLDSDVVMYASNSIRPRASMGGVVEQPVNDVGVTTTVVPGANPPTTTVTLTSTRVITDAFLPGQIRMGPVWDPFGESRAELQQDWWRAFAHEFGHYLLYLPDNYLGYNASGIVPVDCKNSFMTTTYDDDYSEFLTAAQWSDPQKTCGQTIAALTTGRADWETIKRFYPPVDARTTNPGPAILPLDLTNVRFVQPSVPARALPARNFDLRARETGDRLIVDQGRAVLFQTQGTAALEDDTLIDLGATGRSDSIKVRGAELGDRVCVFDTAADPPRVGCNNRITAANPVIQLDTASGWEPNIAVQPLSMPGLVLTVTRPISGVAPGIEAAAQIGPAPMITVTRPVSSYKPVTLVRQEGGPMVAIAVAEDLPASEPRLVIRQVSGPAVAIRVTQPFAGDQPAVVQVLRPALAITVTQPNLSGELNVQVYPAYRIPHRQYTALSPWAKEIPTAGSSSTYRSVVPVEYPLFSGFVRVWSKTKEAVSQFFISRDRQADGSLRWGAVDGFTMGVDDRFGLGPDDRFGSADDRFGLGPDDRFGSADDRFGLGPDDRFGSADDRFGLGPDDRFGSADDRFGLGPDDRFGSADDRFGLGPDDRFGSADYRGYGANRRSLDAPIASEDAQVIIFNRGDVLGDPGALSLQALASIPNLPSWLTSAGRGYRFEASARMPRTIAFSYLRREVPEGYEQNLQVYYSPDEGASWQRLPTYLDADENLATAPADASGLYVLAAAVDIPFYTSGWNLFAYPVPKTRSVDETLLSASGVVSTVFGYDSADVADPWKVYDLAAPAWVNDLQAFEFGHAYWISVTRPITLQIAVAEAEPLPAGQAQVVFANPVARRTPPAVFYGEVGPDAVAGLAEGDRIVAMIDGVPCGAGQVVRSVSAQTLRYIIKVDAADIGGAPRCGAPGRLVIFAVDGRPVSGPIPWNNSRPLAIELGAEPK